ncbi:MAG: DNA mismatch repair endonuclease MutL, partial [Bacteroidia bacterium]
MTDIIKLLPDNIANQIAAGEVVQRPASVVKELLENSVDAGSQNIKLFVKNGGKTLIQVIDDGCGMSETDARMCFERHATSKIQQLNDLYEIYTLGFRGEAMASIAAVAQVELKTKRRTEDVGTHIHIENSEVISQEPCACPEGSSIAVKNLFYNVPARRNFLKSNPVELRHIVDEFLRVALANPEISFSFTNENEEVYHLKGGNLKQRIIGIWGKKYEEALVPIEETTDILTIRGFIGKPDWARKTRGEQFFFANNRFIKNNYLNHALQSAYEGLLPADAFPFYTIFLQLPPSKIDINVHPTKTEIKFENEKAIYAILQSAVRKSLSQYHIAPTLNFDEEMSIRTPEREMPRQNPYTQQNQNSWIPTSQPGYNPDRNTSQNQRQNVYMPAQKNASGYQNSNPFQQQKAKPEEWEELYKVLSMATPEEEPHAETETLIEGEETAQKPVLQLNQKYIVSSIRSGLMIVHQQLAHERVLYEKYLHVLAEAKSYSQRLLFPEVLNLHGSD